MEIRVFVLFYSLFTIHDLPDLARLRTYPQHTPPLLPLLRSRPGGVHKASVVRSPKSDNLSKHCRLRIADFPLVIFTRQSRKTLQLSKSVSTGDRNPDHFDLIDCQSQIGNRQSAMAQIAVFRCASMRSNPLIARCNSR